MRLSLSRSAVAGFALGTCLLTTNALPARAQTPSEQTASQHKFLRVELLPITVQPGVTISDDYVKGTQVRIAKALEDTKHFDQVAQPINASAVEQSTLRVTPTITNFVAGSRAERYLIGFGAGATKLTVHFVFSDAETGKLLLEEDVKGLIWFGAVAKGFGNPNSAQKDIAHHIQEIVDKHF